jgi:carboxymethylenebutenolidase
MSETILTIPGQSPTVDALVITPDGTGPFDVVVVVHGAFESLDGAQQIGRRFAEDGFLAIVPALRDAALLRPTVTNRDLVLCVERVIDFARDQPGASGSSVNVVGFGIGGFVALLAGCHADVASAVSFYPRGIVRPIRGLRIEPILRDMKSDVAPFLGLFGAQDERVRPEDVAKIRARLVLCRAVHELIVYPHAKNGFFMPSRDEYRAEAAAHAWTRTLEWVRRRARDSRARA